MLRYKRTKIIIYKIKIKSISKNIKKKRAKTIKKLYKTIYYNIKIKKITYLLKRVKKKKKF